MRVVHVTPTYFAPESVIGGGERFPMELARAMAKHVDTSIVSFGPAARMVDVGGVTMRVYRRWNNNPNNPVNPSFLRDLLSADVIHCHQYQTIATNLATAFAKTMRRKIFATDLGGGGRNLAFYVNLTRFLNGYLLLSQNSADLQPFTKCPIRIIYAGVDLDLYRPGRRPKERKIVFVGRFIPNKGIDVLIEAMPPNLRLHVIGTPYDERHYRDLQRLAEGKDVRFLTGLSHEEIADEYASALACVLPAVIRTRYGTSAENVQLFALPPVEAMASDTIAIATNIFAHPEIIRDGETGFLVPPNDVAALRECIQSVVSNPETMKPIIRRAREMVHERFTWDATVRRCLDAYRTL